MLLLDLDAVHDMDAVSGSRRELVRAATIASQWPVLNFGNIVTQTLRYSIWIYTCDICTFVSAVVKAVDFLRFFQKNIT